MDPRMVVVPQGTVDFCDQLAEDTDKHKDRKSPFRQRTLCCKCPSRSYQNENKAEESKNVEKFLPRHLEQLYGSARMLWSEGGRRILHKILLLRRTSGAAGETADDALTGRFGGWRSLIKNIANGFGLGF